MMGVLMRGSEPRSRSFPNKVRSYAFLLLCTAAHADYQTGLNAYVDGDFERAMAEWKAEVNQPGEPENLAIYRETLYAIGMLSWPGEGVEQDYTISAVWLKQAADINHPGAQNKLGYLHSTGQGLPQNYREARRYFEMAAAQGDPDATHNLDLLFRAGHFEPVAVEQVPEVPPGDAGAAWIRAQNPEHYTIQVIALRAPGKLHAFIAGHPDWAPFAIYRPAGNELPLSVLVQGVYPDAGAARAAVEAFPSGLQRREQMWIRTFAKVQALIE